MVVGPGEVEEGSFVAGEGVEGSLGAAGLGEGVGEEESQFVRGDALRLQVLGNADLYGGEATALRYFLLAMSWMML